MKWSKNNADIERIERFVVAYDYSQAQKTLDTSKDEVRQMKEAIAAHDVAAKSHEAAAEEKQGEVDELKERLAGEVDAEHREAKVGEESISKDLVKANSALQNAQKTVLSSEADLAKAEASVTDAASAVTGKNAEIAQDALNGEATKAGALAASEKYSTLQDTYQNMCAGISSSEDASASSLPDQIAKASEQANRADSEIKQATMKVQHLGKSVKAISGDMKKEEKAAAALNAKKAKCQAKAEKLQATLASLEFSEENETALYDSKQSLENQHSNLSETVQTLSAQLEGRLAFNYKDPTKNFDRSKVKGLVANLVSVANSKNATALEVVAGGKLFQVVVDEAATGKALLANGKLQRRVTIIPLDKISSRPVPSDRVSLASNMASKMGTTATPAIELVGYDEDVRTAVEYVFGSSLVVDGMEAANKICDATKTKTVTLQGDVYDPSGTISGGSNKNLGTTLAKLSELSAAKQAKAAVEAQLRTVSKEWESLRALSAKHGSVSDELEIAAAELAAAAKHLGQTKFGMLEEKFENMTKEVEDAEATKVAMEAEKVTKWALYNDLKAKEKELTMAREEKLKGIESEIVEAKKLVDSTAVAAQKVGNNADTLRLELESLQKEVAAAEVGVEAMKKASVAALEEKATLESSLEEQQEAYSRAKDKLKAVEGKIGELAGELKKLGLEKTALKKSAETASLEMKKLAITVKRFGQEKGQAEKFVRNALSKHTWIESEKEHFGVTGGDYDFEALDPIVTTTKLKKLRDEQSGLSKKINKKVMGMIEKAEGEYSDLLRKKKVIENDKTKIEGVIDELDKKKKSELTRTYKKVNADFGSIFTTLLPGTTAKLEPPTVNGKKVEIWEGLEVKVQFGSVWKQSLTELSGGQRSLLALSLILSMLLFKPAPMYILDEVDAALDLSHTQNIGNMLRTHFSQSQFIVVSLKEGMFNNANTIFRTKFVDGVSTVARTIGIGASDKGRALKESNSGSGEPKKKKTATGARGGKAGGVEN